MCSICYDKKTLVKIKNNCNHKFCKPCFLKIIQTKNNNKDTLIHCPLCRRDIMKTNNKAVNRKLNDYNKDYELQKKYPSMGITRTYIIVENIHKNRRKINKYPEKYKFKTYQNY